VAVEDQIFLLYPSDDVDVAVGDDDGFGVVGQVIQVVELLDLVGFVLHVEEIAVVLFDGEDGDLLHLLLQIGVGGY